MLGKMNITEARRQFLSLPEKMAPGGSIEIVRHKKTILKIVRVTEGETDSALTILDQAIAALPKPKHKPPRSLAGRYKKYLYDKKNYFA